MTWAKVLPIDETRPAETHFVMIGFVSSFLEYQTKNENRGLIEEEATVELPFSENFRNEQSLMLLPRPLERDKTSPLR